MIFPKNKQIYILCGTGGVGKTSVAAALALSFAKQGKNIAVITIDPAKRLASALELKNLEPLPKDVSYLFQPYLSQTLKGSISALVYDPESTLDIFVREEGGNEIYNKLKQNSLYQIISQQFSGMHEYLVLEKMHELKKNYTFDALIIDTPPSQHLLDFLDAPLQVAKFFDDKIFRWFQQNPSSSGFLEKIRSHGVKKALDLLSKITGEGVIHDFTEMVPSLASMRKSFIQNQKNIQNILQSNATGAIFISHAQNMIVEELENFFFESKKREIQPVALFLNRSLEKLAPHSLVKAKDTYEQNKQLKNISLYWENYSRIRSLADMENRHIAALKKSWKEPLFLAKLSELEQIASPLEMVCHISREIDAIFSKEK